jgi:predicted TPR repeat methyltransferase
MNINGNDIVLDTKCGMGGLSLAIGDIAKHIVAIDSRESELEKAKKHSRVVYKCWNFQLECLIDNYFSKVVARRVFPYLSQPKRAIKHSYTMLARGGWLIMEDEGIYPIESIEVRNWYANMIALKEARFNFSIEELIALLRAIKFGNIEYKVILIDNFSVHSWLDKADLTDDIYDRILEMYIEAPKEVKDFYNMRIVDKEVIITNRVLLMKGQKI